MAEQITFDRYIGMEHVESEDALRASIEIQPHHLNPTGNINGGVIISLADNLATGVASRAYQEKTGEQKFMVGVDLHAVMLSNQPGGTIFGESKPVRVGRRVTVIRTRITGDDGRLLAEITTTHVPIGS